MARVEYEITAERAVFRFRRMSSDPSVTGVLRYRNPRGRTLTAHGGLAPRTSAEEWIEVPIAIDAVVTIEQAGRAPARRPG
ncbi:hypothetical protein HNP84_003536 [Thermocatellispora tengchongensis]|uniref:Uncharacterized protein n=1 Tax=Thermocatellispora tengchongensis TaxID=1073253 RepID=A0A840P8P6_9ACTN|nr:hypothetical protein [Thermocatellispora tengchongensis]MBB5133810.1 hypothetical protein [Thermocatellispora tengchongensis]